MSKEIKHDPDMCECPTQLAEAKGENMKLNIILFHRENGLSHPDLKGEIKKSKMAEQLAKAEGENELLKAQLSKYLNEPETLTTTEAEQAKENKDAGQKA